MCHSCSIFIADIFIGMCGPFVIYGFDSLFLISAKIQVYSIRDDSVIGRNSFKRGVVIY